MARSSAESMGDSILSTVRKAARFAVYDEMIIKVKNHQIPPTILVDRALGISSDPVEDSTVERGANGSTGLRSIKKQKYNGTLEKEDLPRNVPFYLESSIALPRSKLFSVNHRSTFLHFCARVHYTSFHSLLPS